MQSADAGVSPGSRTPVVARCALGPADCIAARALDISLGTPGLPYSTLRWSDCSRQAANVPHPRAIAAGYRARVYPSGMVGSFARSCLRSRSHAHLETVERHFRHLPPHVAVIAEGDEAVIDLLEAGIGRRGFGVNVVGRLV